MDNFPHPSLTEIVALAPENIKAGYVGNDSSKNSFWSENKCFISKPIIISKIHSSYAQTFYAIFIKVKTSIDEKQLGNRMGHITQLSV